MSDCVCMFTVGLDELPKRKQTSMFAVARALEKAGRFSVFEATANQTIARTMDRIIRARWFDTENQGYPWTGVRLTGKGRKALSVGGGR